MYHHPSHHRAFVCTGELLHVVAQVGGEMVIHFESLVAQHAPERLLPRVGRQVVGEVDVMLPRVPAHAARVEPIGILFLCLLRLLRSEMALNWSFESPGNRGTLRYFQVLLGTFNSIFQQIA